MMPLDPAWGWLIAAIVLAIAEMLVPGVFLIWLGLAAAIAGVAALALPIPLAAQFGLFAAAAVAAVFAGRQLTRRAPIISDDPLLNERTARLIGRTVIVVGAIADGEGRVRVGDGVWNATGPDAAAGARVRIVGADGGRLVVEPIAPAQG